MKKRILLTALLLPTLMFTSPVNAADIVSGETYSGFSGGTGSVMYLAGTGSEVKSAINNVFKNNTATSWGGAAYVTNAKLEIDGSTFANNTASWAGAIASGTNNSNLVINNSVFENNSALAIGAVGVFKNATITNTQFVGNKATDAADDGAGALFVGSEGAIARLDNVIFRNNTSANSGGAIGTRVAENANGTKNDNSAAVLNITNSTFEGNTAATTGGAIDNHFYSAASGIATSTFKNNSAASGGAIYNHGEKDFKGNAANLKVMDTVFAGNSATKSGGAIYSAADMQLTNVEFDGNNAGSWGGAAYVTNGTLTIENGTFANNTASWAGAIASGTNNSNLVINNSVFENNSALAIGAVGVFKNATITNTQFVGNKATDAADDGAGALFLGAESHTVVENSVFKNNYSASRGGAIATRDINQGNNIDGKLDISNSTFINNEAAGDGGAIYNAFSSNNYPQNISLVGVTFDGNKAGGNGGAIYNAAADLGGNVSSVYITDSSFTNNSAAGLGGAIYSLGTVNIEAKDANVVFANNTSSTGSNDIYMAAAGSNLNIKVADGKTVTFESGIAGNNFNLNINTVPMARFAMLRAAAPVEYNGSVVIKSAIENATVNVNSGELHLAEGSSIVASTVNMADGTTLNTINGAIDDYGSSINVGNDVTLAVDVYMADGSADKIDDIANASTVTIEEINPIGNTTENNINFNIAEALGINPSKMTISDALQQETQKVLTPIRYLTGSVDAQGNATFVPTGNSYKDFNPGVMASSVAAQLGGLFNQYNSYNQAFMNMDMRMQMNSQERQALRLKNSIASTDTTAPMVYSPIFQPDKNKGGWMRGYSTFESVNMDGGPKVNNVMYGTFFGGDSDMQQLANGGEVQYSVYAGYNGSHQTYSGNSMWQNGGTMGVTGAYYKDNFFTALTANVGASVVDATTLLGKEDFSMLAAGIASKTGYNIELADGKFIVQPNYLMSYSFVNTFDYTNAAGVRIDSDPLNAIQIAPGVKFIGNLKNGWQPYASVRMVWNLMDKTDFTAANTSLPELSIKPWVEYGVGVQKRWGERFTGFAQTMLRSGGRNGVSLGLGFRWAIGKAPEKNPNARNFTPELPKTKVSIGNVK